jgi:hypothetical protein
MCNVRWGGKRHDIVFIAIGNLHLGHSRDYFFDASRSTIATKIIDESAPQRKTHLARNASGHDQWDVRETMTQLLFP